MEEKKEKSVRLSTFLFVLAFAIVIAVTIIMFYFYGQESKKISELEKEIAAKTTNEVVTKPAVVKADDNEVVNSTATNNPADEEIVVENTIVSENTVEKNDTTKKAENKKSDFTTAQVKEVLKDYLDLYVLKDMDTTDLLYELSSKGKVKYNDSKDKEQSDGTIVTNVKYEDYKKAMLNYVSEKEFDKNWAKSYGKNSKGYVIAYNGGGSVKVYTIKSIKDKGNNKFKAQTTYIEDESEPTPMFNRGFTLTVKSQNDKCVIDTIM